MHPILRGILGVLLLIVGFILAIFDLAYIWQAITDNNHVMPKDVTTKVIVWAVLALVGCIFLALTWFCLYKGYKLCRPRVEKKKEKIEFLGEEF